MTSETLIILLRAAFVASKILNLDYRISFSRCERILPLKSLRHDLLLAKGLDSYTLDCHIC